MTGQPASRTAPPPALDVKTWLAGPRHLAPCPPQPRAPPALSLPSRRSSLALPRRPASRLPVLHPLPAPPHPLHGPRAFPLPRRPRRSLHLPPPSGSRTPREQRSQRAETAPPGINKPPAPPAWGGDESRAPPLIKKQALKGCGAEPLSASYSEMALE